MKLPSREAGIETVKGLWSAPLREPQTASAPEESARWARAQASFETARKEFEDAKAAFTEALAAAETAEKIARFQAPRELVTDTGAKFRVAATIPVPTPDGCCKRWHIAAGVNEVGAVFEVTSYRGRDHRAALVWGSVPVSVEVAIFQAFRLTRMK